MRRIQRTVSLMLVLALCLGAWPLCVTAQGYARGFDYTLREDGGAVIYEHGHRDTERLTIPETLDGHPVVGISNYVFTGCSMVSLDLPSTLEFVGESAFQSCRNLQEVALPEGVTSVGEHAFGWCDSLTAVSIPNTVSYIGETAFVACTALTDMTVAADNPYFYMACGSLIEGQPGKKFGKLLASGAYGTIPTDGSVSRIGHGAFEQRQDLYEIIIPPSVSYIGDFAFFLCINLQSLHLPDTVLAMGENAFGGCHNIQSLRLSNSLRTIPTNAFSACTGLKTVVLPPSVERIGDNAFGGTCVTLYVHEGSTVLRYADLLGVPYQPIKAPTVALGNATAGIKVTWTPSPAATGYWIYRRELKNGRWSGWQRIKGRVPTATSWVDTTAKPGVDYRYTVRAAYDDSLSGFKASAPLRRLATPAVKVGNVTGGVKVTWNKTEGVTGYWIYRRELKNGQWTGWQRIKGRIPTATSWVDTTAKPGVDYRYTVRAAYGDSLSAFKATVPLRCLTTPTVKAIKTGGSLKVTWSKARGAATYTVYRRQRNKTGWSGWQVLTGTSANSLIDVTAKPGVPYRYTVRAVYGSARSAYVSTGNVKR